MTETEHYDDDGTWIGLLSDVVEDVLEQQVPGSVFLTVVVALSLAWGARELLGFFGRRKGRRSD